MGILNLTPDSFHAAGRGDLSLLDAGADILDIGACSTRPGSEPVGPEEEWRRLEPVLRRIAADRARYPEISIDSYWSEVIARADDLLPGIIANDISCGDADPAMLPLVAERGLRYVAMHHGKHIHAVREADDPAADIVAEELAFFENFASRAAGLGIDWILDPGFGFGKTVAQNLELLRSLGCLKRFGREILVGVSRKSMFFRPLGTGPEDDATLAATLDAEARAVRAGATILRVHDVAATRAYFEKLKNRDEK